MESELGLEERHDLLESYVGRIDAAVMRLEDGVTKSIKGIEKRLESLPQLAQAVSELQSTLRMIVWALAAGAVIVSLGDLTSTFL